MKSNLNIFLSKLILLCICIHLNLFSYSTEPLKPHRNISEYSHRSWDSKNGFLPYSINIILQTRDGYLWLGTDEGLVRFDGMEFSTFNTSNTKAFKTNNISSLVEDRDGRLWIGCRDGGLLSYYDDSFTYYLIKDSLKDDRILSMCLDHENNLWIGTNSNLSYISLDEIPKQTFSGEQCIPKLSDIDFSIYYATSLFCDAGGVVWVVAKGTSHIVRISSGNKEKKMIFGTPIQAHIQCFLSDTKGRNWVGTGFGLKVLRDNNLYLFSAKNGLFNFGVTSLIEDQIGNLWIGTHGNGLYKLDTAGYINKFYVKDEISLDRVMSLFEDTEGGIWIGTRGGGLHRLQKKIFKTYTTNDGLSDNRVWSICESRNNDIWIGTQKGLNKLSFGKSSVAITRLSIPGDEKDDIVRTIIEDHSGVLWISTKNNIFRYVNQKIEQHMSFGWARAMAVDSANRMWIGGVGAGLVRVQKESYQKYFAEGRNLHRDIFQIKVICFDDKGSLWFGTKDGLYQIKGDSLYYFDKEPALTGNAVMTLFNDSKGILWITVYGFGLFRFNTEDSKKQFSHITRDNGLIDNTIYSILEDDYGKFWFGSNKGIFSINRKELVEFCDGKISSVHSVAYGLEAGMESIECNGGNHPSAIKSRDGRLWFPTMGGVTVVDPSNLNQKQDSLKVYIPKTIVDGVELLTNRLQQLEPGNKRKIEFRYTAINFSNPENVRFKYRLEGYEDDWIDAKSQRTIYYLNVPPGRYTFRVIASMDEQAWRSNEAAISFEIPPHFWETSIFKILAGIFILGIIVSITRFLISRKLKHHKHLLEQQSTLEQERLRISRDIHDEIGSRLTKISILNEAIKDEIEDTPSVQEFTEKISSETKQIIENLDEIIWFINPGNDSIELLGTFLREYIVDFFSSTDIECNCDFPDSYPDMQISPEVRRNTVLTVKEITNNIVKHALAKRVNAKFQLQEQSILISLKDNGKGFCTRESHPHGNGLINIQKRIEEIGGKIIIESVISSGTAIQIFIPLKNT